MTVSKSLLRRLTAQGAVLITVCAWCPDAKEQTESARAHGFDVSHGICPSCQDKLRKESR